jgi:hypothetical protein
VTSVDCPPRHRVGQQLHAGRLVHEEPADEIRMAREEFQADRAAPAAAINVGRDLADGLDDRRSVIGVQCHGQVLGLTVERAA